MSRARRAPAARAAAAVTVALGLAVPGAAVLAFRFAEPAARAARAVLAVHAARAPRVAIVLIDTNISPPAARLASERREATAYVRALPPGAEVGLITFGDGWRLVLAPASRRSLAISSIAAVRPAGFSSQGMAGALAGAVAEITRLGAAASSRLLLLSDGEMLTQPPPPVTIPVDVVSAPDDHQDDYLVNVRQVAIASHGRRVDPGGVARLAEAFPAAPGPLGAPGSPGPASPGGGHGRPAAVAGAPAGVPLPVMACVVFVALLFFAVLALRSLRPGGRSRLARQIGRYGPSGLAPAGRPEGRTEGRLARRAIALTSRLLRARHAEPLLARRLESAGIIRPPAEWALLGVSVSVTLAAVLALLLGNLIVGVVAGLAAGWAGMRLLLSVRIARRRTAFDEQLPNVLQLLASSVQSGFSLPQALDAVVREDAQPASGEFARALAESRIGVDLADAMDAVAARLGSSDLRWVVMAVRIQRETGGNLAEVLRNTAATMRERAYLRRQFRTLSAEGRLSAYILLALPVLVGAWLFYSDPSYMRPLYLTFLGLAMLAGSGLLIVIGAIWMRNLVKAEV